MFCTKYSRTNVIYNVYLEETEIASSLITCRKIEDFSRKAILKRREKNKDPVDTGCKLNVLKTLRRPEPLMYAQFTSCVYRGISACAKVWVKFELSSQPFIQVQNFWQ